jgi:hypothetical protein
MDHLIEALTILRKYGNPFAPLHCEHDVLHIVGIEPDIVSDEDRARLAELGFHSDVGSRGFYSYRFGSA